MYIYHLVGGEVSTHLKKYAHVKMGSESSPNFRGENKKIFETTT